MPKGLELNYPIQTRYSKAGPGSPPFDLNRPIDALEYLGKRLDFQQHEAERRDLYYEGDQPLSFMAEEVRLAVGNRLRNLVVNWPALKVNSLEERLFVEGFRLPSGDYDEGWRVWQDNDMDEQAPQAHLEAFVHGCSYVIVWGGDNGAIISAESPRQMIMYRDPRTRKPTHALKRWVEDDGYAWSVLYTASSITTWRSKSTNADTSDYYSDTNNVLDLSHMSHYGWDQVDEIANRLGVLPVVALVNKPRLLRPQGTPELDTTTLALADAVNKLCTDMMVSAEFHAMPRRWATGVELETTVTDEGDVIRENFNPIGGRTWIVEDPAARIGQLPEAELSNFIKAVEMLGAHLASTGSIPQHYIDPRSGSLASAEARRAAEQPLVVKAKRRMKAFSGPWEQVQRLAAMVEGRPADTLNDLETVWADPEIRTDAQKVDAASKRQALGIPIEQVWEDAGYSATQIKKMRKMLDDQPVTLEDGSDVGNP